MLQTAVAFNHAIPVLSLPSLEVYFFVTARTFYRFKFGGKAGLTCPVNDRSGGARWTMRNPLVWIFFLQKACNKIVVLFQTCVANRGDNIPLSRRARPYDVRGGLPFEA